MAREACSSIKPFLAVGLLLLVILAGCTHKYVPEEYPIKPGMVPEFKGNQEITIINAQGSSEEVLIGSQGFHKWYGDLQKWTSTAIGVLKTELANQGIPVSDNAEKKLKLAVTNVNIYFEFFTIRCVLNLKVETGDGYSREFKGDNASPATLYRACAGAVTRAVAAMLNDDTIIAYLKL